MLRDRLRPPSASSGRGRAGAAVIGALRVGIGLGMAVRPELVPRSLGVDSVSARRMDWMVRMCAVRDAALGAGGLHAAVTSADVRPWFLAQAVADAGDATALALAVRARQVSAVRGVIVAVVAAAAVAGAVVGTLEASGPRRM